MSWKILAVDDSPESLALIEIHLRGDEFDLSTARSGAQALELVRGATFDLILMDVAMPQMDGIEVCRRLKADPRSARVPVVFLTGRRLEQTDRLHAFEVGAVDYIGKPVVRDELLARIRAMLRLRREQAELERENRRMATLLQMNERCESALREEVAAWRAIDAAAQDSAPAHFLLDAGGRVRQSDAAGRRLAGGDPCGMDLEALGERLGVPLLRLPTESTVRAFGAEPGVDPGADPEPTTAAPRHCELLRTPLGEGWELLTVTDVSLQRLHGAQIDDLHLQHQALDPARAESERRYRISSMVGSDEGLAETTALVDRLRNVRSTVLVRGETGTGKELVARALHYDGKHSETPFIPIHCGAISPDLIESELFGYEKGAFTGAQSSKQGLFTAADGGTVFLDEVSEMPRDLQVKLLRVLQLGEVRPVGASHARHVDVRILAASNRDLYRMVQDGDFREDLFYRLDVVTIDLPALRDRPGDILTLVRHFIHRCNVAYELPRPVQGVSRGAARLLEGYHWPGNVRELENAIERAFSLGCSEVIQVEDLPESLRSEAGEDTVPPYVLSAANGLAAGGLRGQRVRTERGAIEAALSRFGGDKIKAAAYLGFSRSTIYRKIKGYGIQA